MTEFPCAALEELNLLVSSLWPRLSNKKATEVREAFERAFTERRLLAMLAAKEPQFNNPLVAWHAEALRDRVLAVAATAPRKPI